MDRDYRIQQGKFSWDYNTFSRPSTVDVFYRYWGLAADIEITYGFRIIKE